ncbi:hypothetical protein [Streptomyces sp. NPDC058545]|uniref:hypothetical protein n=1 Tax=Streptomyces sp. NPDC058545 TaxID=3346544 RepID=UPI0036698D1B
MLYPHNLDLHSYRILLMAATGYTSEEVVALHEDDIEYGPRSVLIDFTKQRARTTQRSAYSTPAQKEDQVLHPSGSRLDVAEVTRSLLALARPLAERSAIAPESGAPAAGTVRARRPPCLRARRRSRWRWPD